MNDAFLDGYMHKQAISPALLRRLGAGAWRNLEKGVDRVFKYTDDPLGKYYKQVAARNRKGAEAKAAGEAWDPSLHRILPKEKGTMMVHYPDATAADLRGWADEWDALARGNRMVSGALGGVGTAVGGGLAGRKKLSEGDPENTADTPTAPTKKPNPLSKLRK